MSPKRPRIFVALGSNLGDRAATLRGALDSLARTPATAVVARSRFIETTPLGPSDQGRYLNAACELQSDLDARSILDRLLEIEAVFGRCRTPETRWGPRTLDLDLLFHGDSVIEEPGLTLPHPRLHERSFVLIPLAEIAEEFVHPLLGRSVEWLRDRLRDTPAGSAGRSGIPTAPDVF